MTTERPVSVLLWLLDGTHYQVSCKLCGLQWPLTIMKGEWFCKKCNRQVEVEKKEFKQ